MDNPIETGDIVKITEPIPLETLDGKRVSADYGIVVEILSNDMASVVSYTNDGKILLRKYQSITLPIRVDYPIKYLKLFLKGYKPDADVIQN